MVTGLFLVYLFTQCLLQLSGMNRYFRVKKGNHWSEWSSGKSPLSCFLFLPSFFSLPQFP